MENPNTTYISKLDAGKRQLELAIRLFMSNSDIVAIHTLAAAAHTIFRDLLKKQGKGSTIKDNFVLLVKPEYQKEFLRRINKAENFFKHADNDHDKLLEFTPEQTEMFLWDCCSMYQDLTGEATPLIIVYRFWYFAKNPDMLADINIKDQIVKATTELDLDHNNRQQFFQLLPNASKLN